MDAHRPVIIAGNWKMYKTIGEAAAFVKELLPLLRSDSPTVYLAVPFTALKPLADLCADTPIVIGAQNMHDAEQGAFTGEIAGRMLKDAGARYVILGHSERRTLFQETNVFINRKIKRAVEEGIQPLLCIGESLEQREQGQTLQVLQQQLRECLAEVKPDRLILAYEPIWAIGSSMVATVPMIQEAQRLCRQVLADIHGDDWAERIVILYGGSVNAKNVHELMEDARVDGLLVGGASLSSDSFGKIVNYQTTTR